MKAIARERLDGDCDVLLGCRKVDDNRSGLRDVSEGTLDTFFGVSSETDDPPIGLERRLWAPEALRDGEIT